MIRVLSFLMVLLTALPSMAAGEDVFYNSGKIYVVTGVLAIILAALFVYLWRLDRKISKLEKENEG